MLGEKSNKDLTKEITHLIARDSMLQKNKAKRRAVLALANNMLNEKQFVETLYLEETVIQFLEACAQMKNESC